MVVVEARAIEVAEGIVGANVEARIVEPMVRIADAYDHGRDLALRLFLGGGRHPGDALDLLLERGLDVGDHRLDVALRRGREIFVDVALADRVPEREVERSLGALVTGKLLRRSADHRSVKSEVRLVERARKNVG